jgi:hypothetical protein
MMGEGRSCPETGSCIERRTGAKNLAAYPEWKKPQREKILNRADRLLVFLLNLLAKPRMILLKSLRIKANNK